MDLLPCIQFARPESSKKIRVQAEQSDVEYVIDMLVSYALDEEGSGYLIRVIWAGYDKGFDTREPAANLHKTFLRSYERRKRLKPGTVTF
jgi:hypothetical protein